MPSDVVFPQGCGFEAQGRPCAQGEEKLICDRMRIKTNSSFSEGDTVVLGQVTDRQSGMPLERAIADSVMRKNWECYHCGKPCRYVADVDRFWELGGFDLLENPLGGGDGAPRTRPGQPRPSVYADPLDFDLGPAPRQVDLDLDLGEDFRPSDSPPTGFSGDPDLDFDF